MQHLAPRTGAFFVMALNMQIGRLPDERPEFGRPERLDNVRRPVENEQLPRGIERKRRRVFEQPELLIAFVLEAEREHQLADRIVLEQDAELCVYRGNVAERVDNDVGELLLLAGEQLRYAVIFLPEQIFAVEVQLLDLPAVYLDRGRVKQPVRPDRYVRDGARQLKQLLLLLLLREKYPFQRIRHVEAHFIRPEKTFEAAVRIEQQESLVAVLRGYVHVAPVVDDQLGRLINEVFREYCRLRPFDRTFKCPLRVVDGDTLIFGVGYVHRSVGTDEQPVRLVQLPFAVGPDDADRLPAPVHMNDPVVPGVGDI
ncbi:hypothetical protein DQG23_20740 [Paenibacillus contaminans]|uniref:Uncharacterized protein n=1 Tax=Paenibacillus contaminans TaxID=450362 RepID=A0A329MHT4_9BACL|nr:hypothetical protein DQG23_20740 [Paenibacillus contaminans]